MKIRVGHEPDSMEGNMKRSVVLMFTMAAVFLGYASAEATHQPGGAATPCCQAATKGPFTGQACNENFGGTFTAFPPDQGSVGAGGCVEIDSTGSCIAGGTVISGDTQTESFCICLRRNGRKFECFTLDSRGLRAVGGPKCNLAAVAGCCTQGTAIGGDACH